MSTVIVDGIEYVPKADIPELKLDSDPVLKCLNELVSMHYFGDFHKAKPHTWDAVNAISPSLAKMMNDDPRAAYQFLNGVEPED